MAEDRKQDAVSTLAEAITLALAAGSLAAGAGAGPVLTVASGAAAVAPVVSRKIAEALYRFHDRHNAAILEGRARAHAEWIDGVAALVPGVIERQLTGEVDARAFEEKLVERVEDEQFRRLLDNFGVEATREAIDERRRMLRHATAGAFNVQLTVAEASRVERILRELDPEDIASLRAHRMSFHERDPTLVRHADDSEAILIGAGCLTTHQGAGGGIMFTITGTGDRLLRMLRSYEPR